MLMILCRKSTHNTIFDLMNLALALPNRFKVPITFSRAKYNQFHEVVKATQSASYLHRLRKIINVSYPCQRVFFVAQRPFVDFFVPTPPQPDWLSEDDTKEPSMFQAQVKASEATCSKSCSSTCIGVHPCTCLGICLI